jgi:muramoyltetrapeptide carboxypeptidase LdcA involved in peptidoglycan recycling
MNTIDPLKNGDEIRVIAPSLSQSQLSKHMRQHERAKERLESLGYKVTFGKSINSKFHFGTAKAQDRAKDLNDAYEDKNVKAVLALNGGWSANEVLPYIDWNLLKANPKPLIGFSDITVLLNAIYAKTGNVGYLGPNYGTLGSMLSWRYSLDYLDKVLRQQAPLVLEKSKEWGVKRDKRKHKTKSWKILHAGQAEAVLIGGNVGTFYLLQGTDYQPSFDSEFILAIEDDDESGEYTAREFSRRLESILQLPNARKNLQGIIIGRFKPASKFKDSELESIISSKQLGDIPIVAGVDFGHTLPTVTLPIGGAIRISAGKVANISVISY